jgi:chemotaxis protein methyltransferase CheR
MNNYGYAQVETASQLSIRHLPDADFNKISSIMYNLCGINLHVGKKELVQARMNKRLRQLGISGYGEYVKFVENDSSGDELFRMVDILSTNVTCFFREKEHFEYLKTVFSKINAADTRKLRIWSAGCSSGEEAYSLAALMRESISGLDKIDALILATDISARVLDIAKRGCYKDKSFKDAPKFLREKYFARTVENGEPVYYARERISSLVRFKHLNLTGPWPIRGKFDVIMCRNVMIYFDNAVREGLVARFEEALAPGGLLIVGHSESLTGVKHGMKYLRPAVYTKQ